MVSLKILSLGLLFFYTLSLVPAQAQTCKEYWVCTEWSFCLGSGVQLRTCVDANRCGTDMDRPNESQSCVPIPVKDVVLPPQQQTNGVTGLIISNMPTVLAAVIIGLGVAVYIAYRKWKDIRMFMSSV
jgi:hypothetical protein